MFWGHPEPIVVPPVVNPDLPLSNCTTGQRDSPAFKFEHSKDFVVPITEEFLEHCAGEFFFFSHISTLRVLQVPRAKESLWKEIFSAFTEGALSIEVWGHRSAGFSRSKPGWEVEQQQLAKARSLADRWSELTRKIALWVEIQELNEQGEYSPVDVVTKTDSGTGNQNLFFFIIVSMNLKKKRMDPAIWLWLLADVQKQRPVFPANFSYHRAHQFSTSEPRKIINLLFFLALSSGGIYQLRQGQQRRIQVRVKPVQNSGTLPIICQSILSIAVGSVCVRKPFQKALDSYQDEDLSILREKWSDALLRRRQYLDQQIQKLINKQGTKGAILRCQNSFRFHTTFRLFTVFIISQ